MTKAWRLGHNLMQNLWPSEIKRVAWLAPGLLGWLLGTALQVAQPALWLPWVYVGFVLLALILIALAAIKRIAINKPHAIPTHAVG